MLLFRIGLVGLLMLPGLAADGLAAERDLRWSQNRGAHREWRNENHSPRHQHAPHHSGRWHHGHHDGRIGWWWIVGGARTFYPNRDFSYPYRPPAYVPAPPPPAGEYWYYCASPAGYYPYVARCRVAWQRVPAY